MLYDDQAKKETARKLKTLRTNQKDLLKNVRSHKKLEEEITDYFNNDFSITSKSLANYEVVNKGKTQRDNDKFQVGKGMKIATLVALASFYGVSCDYLLGTKKNIETCVNELGLEMCLDKESIQTLLKLKKQTNDNYYKKLVFTLNQVIHSITLPETEENESKFNIENDENYNYVEESFLNKLSEYFYFCCEPQTANIISKDNADYIFDTYGQHTFSESEVSNLFFIEVQKMITNSRDRYNEIRDIPDKNIEKKLRRIMNKNKGNKK